MRYLAPIGVFVALLGCASGPHEPRLLEANIAAVIKIPASETEAFGNPDSGLTTVDSRFADLKASSVGIARGEIFVIVRDRGTEADRIQFSIPINKIELAAVVPYGNMGHLRQIHVISGTTKYVFSYGITESATAEAFHRRLVALGAKDGIAPTRYVERPGEADVFPIFIPASRR